MNLTQAAIEYPCTKPALYLAIRKSRLSARKKNGKWIVTEKELIEYKKSRWNRGLCKHNGKLIFDKEKGFHSVNEASSILKCDAQHIYYALRNHKIKSHKVKSAWVIHLDDIIDYHARMKLGKKQNRGK